MTVGEVEVLSGTQKCVRLGEFFGMSERGSGLRKWGWAGGVERRLVVWNERRCGVIQHLKCQLQFLIHSIWIFRYFYFFTKFSAKV